MKEFGSDKNKSWQNDSCENLDIFFLAFMGWSTPTTAFDGTIWYFANKM